MSGHPSYLSELRRRLALSVGENAVFDGWTQAAVDAAADTAGVDRGEARLAFAGGAADLIAAYIEAVDLATIAAFPPERIASLRTRERIRSLVVFRLDTMAPAREAVRRALAILAMPHNAPLAARLGWTSADVMWRLAGDTAADFSHYSKRATLLALYGATLLVWINDDTPGIADTLGFLDRRIDDLMRFETAKARWRANADRRPSLARFLGRLRYPAH